MWEEEKGGENGRKALTIGGNFCKFASHIILTNKNFKL